MKGPYRNKFLVVVVAVPIPIPVPASMASAALVRTPTAVTAATAATASATTASATTATTATISVIGWRSRRRPAIVSVIRRQCREPETDPKVFTRHRHERLNAL